MGDTALSYLVDLGVDVGSSGGNSLLLFMEECVSKERVLGVKEFLTGLGCSEKEVKSIWQSMNRSLKDAGCDITVMKVIKDFMKSK